VKINGVIKIYDDDFVIAIDSTGMNPPTDENGYVKDEMLRKDIQKCRYHLT
jgi:hypothetical protein